MNAMVGAVDVEVRGRTAPFDKALKDTHRQLELFDKDATSSFKAVEQASGSMAAKVERDLDRMARGSKKVSESIDPLIAAQGRLGREVSKADAALAKGTITADQHAKAITTAGQRYDKAAGQARRMGDEIERFGKKGQLAKGQLANLTYQLNDIISGIAMGQSPMMILTQQGGQVVQVLGQGPGGVGGSLKALAMRFGPVAAGIGLLGGAFLLGTAAAISYAKASDQAALSLLGLGKEAGQTVPQLMAAAEAAAQHGDISVSAARKAQGAFLRMGVTNKEVIQEATSLIRDYALVTGKDFEKAMTDLGRALADPEKGAADLDKELNFLDETTRRNIITLARHGEKVKAEAALLRALKKDIGDASGEVNGFARAWQNAANAASNFFNAIGKTLTTGVNPAGYANDFRKRAAELRRQGRTEAADKLDAAAQRLEAPQRKEEAEAKRTAAVAERQRLEKEASDLASEMLPKETKKAELTAKITRLEAARKNGLIDSGRAERAIAATRKEIADLDKKSSSTRGDGLRREAESMEVSAAKALDLADAYLEGSAAAMKAEAAREAMTEATRKGVEAEARMRRQLALNIAEQASAGAKNVAALRDQAEAQKAANDNIAAGTMTSGQAQRFMQVESALRPLLAAQSLAEGQAKETLTRVIDALRAAYKGLHDEEARGQALVALEQQADQLAMLELELRLVGANNREKAKQVALLQAEMNLRRSGIDKNSPEGQRIMANAGQLADRGSDIQAAEFLQRSAEDVQRQTAAFREEAAVLGMTHEEAATYRKQHELVNAAMQAGIPLTDAQREALGDLARGYGQAAEEARKLEDTQAAVADAASYASHTIYDALYGITTGAESANEAIIKLLRSLGDAALQGLLLGEGPLAGLFGTADSDTVGGPNGGFLSKAGHELGEWFGKKKGGATGESKGIAGDAINALMGGAPTGRPGDPIFVAMAGGGMGGDPGGNGGIGGLITTFAKSALTAAFGGVTVPGYGTGAAMSASAASLASTNASLVAAGLHGGGDHNTAGFRRVVPAAMFLNAPRFHNGLNPHLRPNEFAAILERGERVQSRMEVANENRRELGPVNIHVHGVRDLVSWQKNDRQLGRELKRRYRLG